MKLKETVYQAAQEFLRSWFMSTSALQQVDEWLWVGFVQSVNKQIAILEKGFYYDSDYNHHHPLLLL